MKLLKKILRIIFIFIPLFLIAFSLLWVLALKWAPVKYTPLMAIRSFEYRSDPKFKTHKTWTGIDYISDNMIRAVMASEDEKFLDHDGFDWTQIGISIDQSKKGKKLRGASTISQQTAKNVFLFPSRSWIRKGLETYYTFLIEKIWGKRRIMEVYLNVVEMGPGIYGAEAASSIYFRKPASRLTVTQAARIAAVLPSPLKRSVSNPSPYVLKRTAEISILINKLNYAEWHDTFSKPDSKNAIKKNVKSK